MNRSGSKITDSATKKKGRIIFDVDSDEFEDEVSPQSNLDVYFFLLSFHLDSIFKVRLLRRQPTGQSKRQEKKGRKR